MTTDTQATTAESAAGPFSYYRDKDGVHDILFIEDTRDGAIVMGIYFWDEPDTNEAAEAEAKAELIVHALNMPGCWIDQYHVTASTLTTHKEIAMTWSIWDLTNIRPDLSEDEAWQVLQQVKRCHDRKRGITLNRIRVTAAQMFPRNARKPHKLVVQF